ncbi:MAG: hypothetical protein WA172_02045, partial [Terriglobales bacterium]
GADRAITVVVAGGLRRTGLRRIHERGVMRSGSSEVGGADDTAEIHVPERHHDLQRQRHKREVCAMPSMAMHPPHERDASVILLH